MIPAGELRHRMTIQAPPTGRDTRGRKSGVWTDVGMASVKIETLSGTEGEKAKQLASTATHQITMRARRKFNLTTKHRFQFYGRFFNIGFIHNVEEINCDWVCLVTEEKA